MRKKLAQETRRLPCLHTYCYSSCALLIFDHAQNKTSIESDVGCVLPQSRMTCSDIFPSIQTNPVTGVLQSEEFQKWFSSPRNERLLPVPLVAGKAFLLPFSSKTSASSAPIGFYKYESHFPFHYSLLQALKCTEFCSDELCKEDLMVQQLTEFLTSGKCLRWFKLVTMIHFAGNFSKILDNVLGAVAKLSDILSNGSCGSPALAAFNEHRVAFFKN